MGQGNRFFKVAIIVSKIYYLFVSIRFPEKIHCLISAINDYKIHHLTKYQCIHKIPYPKAITPNIKPVVTVTNIFILVVNFDIIGGDQT